MTSNASNALLSWPPAWWSQLAGFIRGPLLISPLFQSQLPRGKERQHVELSPSTSQAEEEHLTSSKDYCYPAESPRGVISGHRTASQWSQDQMACGELL